MRTCTLSLLLLLCWSCGSAPSGETGPEPTATAEATEWPLCVASLADMPSAWRPAARAHAQLSQTPWTTAEAADAARAVQTGLDELIAFFENRPESVGLLWDNAVQCFLDISYSASNTPALQAAARVQARRVLSELLAPYAQRDPASVTCDEFSSLLILTVYANQLFPPGEGGTAKMTALTNAAVDSCGSLEAAMGYDYRATLSAREVSADEAYDLVLWSITLIDAELVPDLELPPGARMLVPEFWHFLSHYPLVGARAYADGALNHDFYDTAYLATHIGYVPTGCGRHPLLIEDAPWLYRFLRENFYAVLEMGELDLVGEFVDLLRQYGCTARDDLQVRDGTRYLLAQYHGAGDSWMAHGESRETIRQDAYDLIHKPWTGAGGVRARSPEPSAPGSYGSVFHQAIARTRRALDGRRPQRVTSTSPVF